MNPKIEIIYHYFKDDIKCDSDYISIDVYINGKIIKEYADVYHDSNKPAQSFVDGYILGAGLKGTVDIKTKQINDMEC